MFTQRYQALLAHYGLEGQRIQAGQAHENGDVEQLHHRFKRAVDQELMLRGSRDFADRDAYAVFLAGIYRRANAGRRERFAEEVAVLRRLPERRLDAMKRVSAQVGQGSTIRADHNVYSVHSRLIGESVEVRLYVEHVEVWYAQKRLEVMPRLRGEGKHRIDYRHIIDWLVRKPGAFENYRYREALFPTSRFRMAYDALGGRNGTREYLAILELAAKDGETEVDAALRSLIHEGQPIRADVVATMVRSGHAPIPATEVRIAPVDLTHYDRLLGVR
ncbi:MAG: IS21 family transposase, partial [Acidobacteria bacterium]|nr:IS21 family transposase [Acidobacteriota bacterium]